VPRPIPPIDLIFLLIETADTPMHVGGLMLFDRPPRGADGLVERIAASYRAARPIPPFDQLPVLSPGALPRWERVRRVDLEYHVQHLVLPPHSGERALLRLIEGLHEPLLDRYRPGFRVWLIDGLPQRRFAIYFKVHHSLIDGASATARVVASLSTSPRAAPGAPFFAVNVDRRRRRPPPGLLDAVRKLTMTARDEAAAFRDVSLGLLRKALQGFAARPAAGDRPFGGPELSLNATIRTPRSFATLALSLAEMRSVAHAFDGTINDVAAACVDAGVHAYLAEFGARPDRPLVAMCPVSLREAGDTTATTNAAAMFVPLGQPAAPAVERMRQVVAAMRASKSEIRGLGRDAAVLYAASVLGAATVTELAHAGRVTGHVANLVLSNVPGARDERYLGGARLRAVFPVSVLGAGMGLNVTVASHFDTMGFGFVGNRLALPDMETLASHTRRAFDELAAAAFAITASEWPGPRRPRPRRRPAATVSASRRRGA
jgi:WS/DGAT/MGAT family acyltransferase